MNLRITAYILINCPSPYAAQRGGAAGAGAGAGAPGRGRGRRDNDLIGQTIRISQGPYKGLYKRTCTR